MRERSSGGNPAADGHVSPNRFAWLERVTLDHELSPRAARLAAIIALRYAGKDATAWPSQSTLAADLGLDPVNGVRTVRTLATELEKRGHLSRTPGAGRTSTLYALSEVSTERTPASGLRGRQHPGRGETSVRSARAKQYVESGCPHPPNLLKNLVTEPHASARDAAEELRALAPDDMAERAKAREREHALQQALWRLAKGLDLEVFHGFPADVVEQAKREVREPTAANSVANGHGGHA